MTPIHRKGDPIRHAPPSAVFQNTAEAASTTANQRRPCPDRHATTNTTVRFRSGDAVEPLPAQNRTTTGNPAATHGFPVGASAETTAALIENT